MSADRGRMRMVRPTHITWIAIAATLAVIAGTAAFLMSVYPTLPDLLPVLFNRRSRPIGWQYKTYVRVLMPSLVQAALAITLGSVGTLLLSRTHESSDHRAPDIVAASIAVEAIALVCFVWVAFQAYAAAALVQMWQMSHAGLGGLYSWLTGAGVVMSIAIGINAQRRLARPTPREFVADHWRFGHLYNNPQDPALFVPTRDGSRWTLNFGRPVAAALLGVALLVGVVAPTVILALLLRL
jgi:uncharacterized membrane protein